MLMIFINIYVKCQLKIVIEGNSLRYTKMFVNEKINREI